MARPTVDVQPEMLVWARERSGFKQVDAARKLDVSTQRLASLEQGDDFPSPSLLRKMSDLYRLSPVAFFSREVPATGFEPPADFRTVGSGEVGEFSPALRKEIDRVRAQVTYLKELASDGVVRPRFSPPPLPVHANPDFLADVIRSWLGIDAQSKLFLSRSSTNLLKSWIAAIEGRGVLVAQVSKISVAEMRGFCIYDHEFPLIVLNGGDSEAARLFTLAHELVHVLNGDECVCSGVLGDRKVERHCNAVAAAILIPSERLLQAALLRHNADERKWSLDQLSELAAPFGVSREAVLRRMLTIGYTTESHYQDIRSQLQALYDEPKLKKKSTGGPDRDDMILRNLGTPYVEAVLRARNLGLATDSEIADRLFAKVRWIEVLADRLDMARP